MGKKKSEKITGIWDLTPEEQKRQMDEIDSIISGSVSVMSLVSGKTPKGLNKKGFSVGLESVIAKDILENENNYNEVRVYDEDDHVEAIPYNSYDFNHNDYEPVEPTITHPKTHKKPYVEPSVSELEERASNEEETAVMRVDASAEISREELGTGKMREFKIVTNDILRTLERVVIDDGISPTSVALSVAKLTQIAVDIDASQASDICVQLMRYIITLKHPTAIYDADEFYNTDFYKFGRCKGANYNTERYFFAEAEGYVFCWLLNDDSVKIFNGLIMDNYSETIDEVVATYIGLAYAVGRMDQAFFVEDENYINTFIKSGANNIKEFHNEFQNDLTTQLIPSNEEDTEDDGVVMFDLVDLQASTRNLITSITGDSYFGDDEYEDYGDENEDPNEDSESSEDEGYADVNDIDNMDLSESDPVEEELENEDAESYVKESSFEIDRVSTSSDNEDEFIIPVVRKGGK